MGNIQKPQEIGTKEEAETIGKQMAEKVAKKVKFPQLFPQPLEGRLLTREEVDKVTSVQFSDMRRGKMLNLE